MTQLQPSRCKLAEYQRAIFAITPEPETPFEALLMPHYWAHVSNHFRPGCKLEIFPPEGHYYAELIVQDCGRLFAKVAVLMKVELHAVEVGTADLDLSGYSVRYGGASQQWCVDRLNAKGKKDTLKSECGTKEEAEAWMRQHVRTVTTLKPAAA